MSFAVKNLLIIGTSWTRSVTLQCAFYDPLRVGYICPPFSVTCALANSSCHRHSLVGASPEVDSNCKAVQPETSDAASSVVLASRHSSTMTSSFLPYNLFIQAALLRGRLATTSAILPTRLPPFTRGRRGDIRIRSVVCDLPLLL